MNIKHRIETPEVADLLVKIAEAKGISLYENKFNPTGYCRFVYQENGGSGFVEAMSFVDQQCHFVSLEFLITTLLKHRPEVIKHIKLGTGELWRATVSNKSNEIIIGNEKVTIDSLRNLITQWDKLSANPLTVCPNMKYKIPNQQIADLLVKTMRENYQHKTYNNLFHPRLFNYFVFHTVSQTPWSGIIGNGSPVERGIQNTVSLEVILNAVLSNGKQATSEEIKVDNLTATIVSNSLPVILKKNNHEDNYISINHFKEIVKTWDELNQPPTKLSLISL